MAAYSLHFVDQGASNFKNSFFTCSTVVAAQDYYSSGLMLAFLDLVGTDLEAFTQEGN